jgi:hypothetical protein
MGLPGWFGDWIRDLASAWIWECRFRECYLTQSAMLALDRSATPSRRKQASESRHDQECCSHCCKDRRIHRPSPVEHRLDQSYCPRAHNT